jgi:predicted dinucleotide-binding enzyme
MQIRIFGRGAMAEALLRLAERGGHDVQWAEEGPVLAADDAADLVILTGSRTAVENAITRVAPAISSDLVVVDATMPAQDARREGGAESAGRRAGWIATSLPGACVVRAFASVPADVLAAVSSRSVAERSARVAIPLAGDDPEAKARVGTFMRDVGLEPFDIGALTVSDVLEPGGALWGKALSQVELLEAVGGLSGDG